MRSTVFPVGFALIAWVDIESYDNESYKNGSYVVQFVDPY
jgi:hypothetical protein